jgi:DNA-binding GntR family transcriptional regulator
MDNKINPYRFTAVIKNKSLPDKSADIIRSMIIKGECPLGSRITEGDFAEALGVSRICIREAFLLLENEGLINKVMNKYTEVVDFNISDIDEIYRIRTAIETACLEASVERGQIMLPKLRKQVEVIKKAALSNEQGNIMNWVKEDLYFHEMLIVQSGNRRALKIWHSLENQIKTLLYATLTKYPDSIKLESSNSHSILLDNIEKGETDKAIINLKAHIMGGCQEVIESINKVG